MIYLYYLGLHLPRTLSAVVFSGFALSHRVSHLSLVLYLMLWVVMVFYLTSSSVTLFLAALLFIVLNMVYCINVTNFSVKM